MSQTKPHDAILPAGLYTLAILLMASAFHIESVWPAVAGGLVLNGTGLWTEQEGGHGN